MSAIFELFEMGGSATYVAALLGFVALGASAVAIGMAPTMKARSAAAAIAASALMFSLTPLGMGVVGYQVGTHNLERALEGVDSEAAPRLRARGNEEAFANIIVGSACSAFPFGLALAALGVALLKQRPQNASA